MNKKGFTLLELIIAAGAMGVVILVILSVINPVEQINQSKDITLKTDAVDLLYAYERYYTGYQKYPWSQVGKNNPKGISANRVVLDELISKNIVKPEFQQRKNLPNLYVSVDANGLVHICFVPYSDLYKSKAKYDVNAETGKTHYCVPD